MSVRRLAALLVAVCVLASCDAPEVTSAPSNELSLAAGTVPVMRWGASERGQRWTMEALAALDGPGRPLVEMVPADVDRWCPWYSEAPEAARKAFWVGLLSALAKHESTWRPDVSGGGGKWHGLLQISPATARGYGCAATTPEELKNGAANLRCAIRIMGRTVPRDGVIAAGGRGVAADWGPFHQASKREDMLAWTRAQPYCRG